MRTCTQTLAAELRQAALEAPDKPFIRFPQGEWTFGAIDRDTDAFTAAMTSLRAVQVNFDTMALWALLLVVMIGIGFATMMIGMVILLPLAGHATWHAYRELVR